ncbi:MAG: hypothetical protein U1F57_08575 [bacterium]
MRMPLTLGPLLSCWPTSSVTFFESNAKWSLTSSSAASRAHSKKKTPSHTAQKIRRRRKAPLALATGGKVYLPRF